jgi:hypothetical protein
VLDDRISSAAASEDTSHFTICCFTVTSIVFNATVSDRNIEVFIPKCTHFSRAHGRTSLGKC